MKTKRRILRVFGVVVVLAAIVAGVVYSRVRSPRLTDEMRGYELAGRLGCHGCHGPGGTGGVPNPGSKEAEIPSWDGGTPMMYANSEDEIREWILDGAPRRLTEAHEHEHAPGTEHGGLEPPVHMPAYRSAISNGELELLVAYFKAVAGWGSMPDAALHGRRVAADHGCFGCHGPGGMIGASNPKSFKGYIPPWRGKDFAELVRNDEELRSWIKEGRIRRFDENRLATFFTHRQVIHMPAYGSTLTDEELDAIVAYIHWSSREEQ